MKNLRNLLERFSHSLNKDLILKEQIAKTIAKHTSIKIKEDQISFKEGVLVIETTPVVKSVLSLKESLICEELKGLYQINVKRVLYR